MTWQSGSRTVRLPFPFVGCGGNFLDSEDVCRCSAAPISSTEQMPIPYALRKARLTARVSATRISAPWTSSETLDGSASPYPTNPSDLPVRKTVALKVQRLFDGSQKLETIST